MRDDASLDRTHTSMITDGRRVLFQGQMRIALIREALNLACNRAHMPSWSSATIRQETLG